MRPEGEVVEILGDWEPNMVSKREYGLFIPAKDAPKDHQNGERRKVLRKVYRHQYCEIHGAGQPYADDLMNNDGTDECLRCQIEWAQNVLMSLHEALALAETCPTEEGYEYRHTQQDPVMKAWQNQVMADAAKGDPFSPFGIITRIATKASSSPPAPDSSPAHPPGSESPP